jgi:hypothetical protein
MLRTQGRLERIVKETNLYILMLVLLLATGILSVFFSKNFIAVITLNALWFIVALPVFVPLLALADYHQHIDYLEYKFFLWAILGELFIWLPLTIRYMHRKRKRDALENVVQDITDQVL